MITFLKNPNRILRRTNAVIVAWRQLAPEASFGGMTLSQFEAEVAPSQEVRGKIAELEAEMSAAIGRRALADLGSASPAGWKMLCFLTLQLGGGIVEFIIMLMKKRPVLCALFVFAVVLIAAPSHAQTNSWNVTLSPSSGGTKTTFSLFATGSVTNGFTVFGPITELTGASVAYSGLFGAPPGAWTIADTNFVVPSMGYVTNLTTGASSQLTGISFRTLGGGPALELSLDHSSVPVSEGDAIAFALDETPTVLELDLAFANFNEGTYNAVDTSNSIQFNLEIVPEPSTYALLALSAAGLGGYFLRRRRK